MHNRFAKVLKWNLYGTGLEPVNDNGRTKECVSPSIYVYPIKLTILVQTMVQGHPMRI